MKKRSYILLCVVFIVFGVFFVTEIWASLSHHIGNLTKWFGNHKRSYYPWFLWFTLGAIVFPIMNRYLRKNIEMIKTFTHELTHGITALLTFRRIHSFHAEEKQGVIYTSGSEKTRFLVTLAPYCFPIYTFPLLILRCLVMKPLMPIMDILIGFTVGLHIVCFKEQTGNHQTDITSHPLYFSYIYIITVLLFDICLILLSYEPTLNIFYAFKTMGVDIWNTVASLWR